MKKGIYSFLSLLILNTLVGCNAFEVRKEFDDYTTQVSKWNELEYDLVSSYEESNIDESISEEEFEKILEQTIAKYKTFAQEVKKYNDISDERLKTLHNQYVSLTKLYEQNLSLHFEAYTTGNEDKYVDLEEQIDEYVSQVEKFENDIVSYANELGVDFEWEEIE